MPRVSDHDRTQSRVLPHDVCVQGECATLRGATNSTLNEGALLPRLNSVIFAKRGGKLARARSGTRRAWWKPRKSAYFSTSSTSIFHVLHPY